MDIQHFGTKNTKQHGMIHMIIGPMFSGKTTELFRLANMHILANKKVVIVKYERDIRYDIQFASTHDEKKMKAIAAIHLKDVFDNIKEHDVIGIDEGQFFDDIVCVAEKLASMGKLVIVAALDGDFQRRPFENIINLYPLAEKIKKINAVCRSCGFFASFTFRTTNSSDLEIIGGEDMYQAVCRECFYKLKNNQSQNHMQSKVNGDVEKITTSNNIKIFENENYNSKNISLSIRKNA
uniref:Thymidine kinase n=1 Tax=Strongyloides stercoralis TaxID=6248 RepID=A0A0K0EP09_STRER